MKTMVANAGYDAKSMRPSAILLLAVAMAAAGCNRSTAERRVSVVDPDYVVLRPVTTTPADGASSAFVDGLTVYFKPAERVVDLRDIDPRTVRVMKGPLDTCVVTVSMTPEGNRRLAEWTSANINRRLGIFVDNRLIEAPRVKSRVTNGFGINGDFTRSEAEAIAARLRRGGAR